MMSCIRDGWKTTDCGFIFPHGGAFRQRPTTRQVYIYKTPYGVAGSSLTGSIPCRKVAASAAMPEFPAHQKPKHNPFNGLAIVARARADLKNPPTATQGGFVLIFKDSSGDLFHLQYLYIYQNSFLYHPLTYIYFRFLLLFHVLDLL